MRGYKTRADGTRTTYFHRDVDDSAAMLIGDCTPKRIDVPGHAPSGGPSDGPTLVATKPGGETGMRSASDSLWFSEKDVSAWAAARLKEKIRSTMSLPDLKVTVTGECSILYRENKDPAFPFDLSVSLEHETLGAKFIVDEFSNVAGDDFAEQAMDGRYEGAGTRSWVDKPALARAFGAFAEDLRRKAGDVAAGPRLN